MKIIFPKEIFFFFSRKRLSVLPRTFPFLNTFHEKTFHFTINSTLCLKGVFGSLSFFQKCLCSDNSVQTLFHGMDEGESTAEQSDEQQDMFKKHLAANL